MYINIVISLRKDIYAFIYVYHCLNHCKFFSDNKYFGRRIAIY